MHETSKIKANDAAVYQEGIELLRSEAAEDERARLKHGTDRWNRQPSQKAAERIYAQATEIDGYLKSAASSDDLIKGKLKDSEEALTVLSGTDRDLEEYVPSSRKVAIPPAVQQAAHNLRNTMDEVTRLKSRRRKQIEKVRNKARQDDISKSTPCMLSHQNHTETPSLLDQVILAETARLERDFPMQKVEPAQFETLFERRLQRYDEDKRVLATESTDQDRLIAQLRSANAAFITARRASSTDPTTRDREHALQRLETAYVRYKEIIDNLNQSRTFYNGLAKNVNRFRDECRNFAYQRRIEAGQLEAELANNEAMSKLNLSSHPLQDQRGREEGLKRTQQYNTATTNNNNNRLPAPAEEPLKAPVPTRAPAAVQPPPPTPAAPNPGMWNPEMGIKFAGQGPQQQQQQQPQMNGHSGRGGHQWDASQGVRFG